MPFIARPAHSSASPFALLDIEVNIRRHGDDSLPAGTMKAARQHQKACTPNLYVYDSHVGRSQPMICCPEKKNVYSASHIFSIHIVGPSPEAAVEPSEGRKYSTKIKDSVNMYRTSDTLLYQRGYLQ